MTERESIEEQYEKAFSLASATAPIFSHEAKQQMGKMVEEIARAHENMQTHPGLDPSNRGGFLAEEYHAETFNLDAILKDKKARAITDKSYEWKDFSRSGNDPTTDILIVEDGKELVKIQSKYCATPEDTSRALSEVNNGQIKYEKNDQYLAPSDQVNPTDGKTSISEHAEAASSARAKNGQTTEAEAFNQTSKKTSDTIKQDNISSSKLTKQEATDMGKGDLSKIEKTESKFKTNSTIQKITTAAAGAAAMSAIVSGSINTMRYIQMANNGEITSDEAVLKIIGETLASATDSAAKAGAVVGAHSLIVRHGYETVIIDNIAKQSFNSLLRSNAITIGVVSTIDAIKDLVALGMGNISSDIFFERQGKGLLNTSSGVFGGSLGAVAAEAASISFGISLPLVAPLVGGLAGGLIAGLAMNLAIENHIEKPYRDLVQNTSNLHEAMRELESVSRSIFKGQVVFTKFLEYDHKLTKAFDSQVQAIDRAGDRARSIIAKI